MVSCAALASLRSTPRAAVPPLLDQAARAAVAFYQAGERRPHVAERFVDLAPARRALKKALSAIEAQPGLGNQ
eukprot:11219726-Lingulodinium_polyedra.AAC.1